LSKLQSFAPTTTLALLTVAMLPQDVSSLQSTAKVLINVSLPLAIKLLDNVLSLQLNVMMETNAQLILVMLEIASTHLSIVTTITLAQLTLAICQAVPALTLLKYVTIKAYVQLTLAILAQETASSLISLLN
jgi:hypothetical protein